MRVLAVNDGPAGLQQTLVTPQGELLATLQAAPNVTQGANRAYGTHSDAVASPADGSTVAILALATVKARTSGIFLCTLSIRWVAPPPDVAGETLNWTLRSEMGVGNVVLSNADTFGPATPGGPGEGAFIANAAAGILVTAGGGDSLIVQDIGRQRSVTNNTANVFTWTGVVQNGANVAVETPFPIGSNVLFELLSPGNASQATTAFDQVAISIVEI